MPAGYYVRAAGRGSRRRCSTRSACRAAICSATRWAAWSRCASRSRIRHASRRWCCMDTAARAPDRMPRAPFAAAGAIAPVGRHGDARRAAARPRRRRARPPRRRAPARSGVGRGVLGAAPPAPDAMDPEAFAAWRSSWSITPRADRAPRRDPLPDHGHRRRARTPASWRPSASSPPASPAPARHHPRRRAQPAARESSGVARCDPRSPDLGANVTPVAAGFRPARGRGRSSGCRTAPAPGGPEARRYGRSCVAALSDDARHQRKPPAASAARTAATAPSGCARRSAMVSSTTGWWPMPRWLLSTSRLSVCGAGVGAAAVAGGDAVAVAEDRRGRHRQRLAQSGAHAVVVAIGLRRRARRAQEARHVDGIEVAERAGEGDHLAHQLGHGAGQLARVDAAQAPADQADAPAVALLQRSRRSTIAAISASLGPRLRPSFQPCAR